MRYAINYNSNEDRQVEQAVEVLVNWIEEPNPESINLLNFLTIENNSTLV